MYQEHFGNNIYQQKNDVAIGSTIDFYGAFRKNAHARTKEIYETLEKIC